MIYAIIKNNIISSFFETITMNEHDIARELSKNHIAFDTIIRLPDGVIVREGSDIREYLSSFAPHSFGSICEYMTKSYPGKDQIATITESGWIIAKNYIGKYVVDNGTVREAIYKDAQAKKTLYNSYNEALRKVLPLYKDYAISLIHKTKAKKIEDPIEYKGITISTDTYTISRLEALKYVKDSMKPSYILSHDYMPIIIEDSTVDNILKAIAERNERIYQWEDNIIKDILSSDSADSIETILKKNNISISGEI